MDAAPDPQWAEMPKPGETLHGLRRSTLYRLCVPCADNSRKPPVLSVCIKTVKKSKRGKRLISIASLLSYLDDLARRAKAA